MGLERQGRGRSSAFTRASPDTVDDLHVPAMKPVEIPDREHRIVPAGRLVVGEMGDLLWPVTSRQLPVASYQSPASSYHVPASSYQRRGSSYQACATINRARRQSTVSNHQSAIINQQF
jgi:hypothetical protein